MSLESQLLYLQELLYLKEMVEDEAVSEQVRSANKYCKKLQVALKGINDPIGSALKELIVDHNAVVPGYHIVTPIHYQGDPYTGDHIDQYILFLDAKSAWYLDWMVYEYNNLHVKVGDSVLIERTDNEYFMVIGEVKIPFIKKGEISYYSIFK